MKRWTIVQRSDTLSGMRCVFCLSSDPPSRFTIEHVFPEAVGGTLTVPFVCKDCNDRLGHSVDVTVTNHLLVVLRRFGLRLRGKSGSVPNPFERGVLSEDPRQRVRFDPTKPLPDQIYTIPYLKRRKTKEGADVLDVLVDRKDSDRLESMINTALLRAGAPPLTPEALQEVLSNVTVTDSPVIQVPMDFDPIQYRRGLMKIVYELACYWLGDIYVDDPLAPQLRQFIFDDTLSLGQPSRYPIRGDIRDAPATPKYPFWPDEPDCLIGFVPTPFLGCIYVSVFGELDAVVEVTNEPSRYAAPEGHFVCINVKTGSKRESTADEEMVRICERAEADEHIRID